MKNILTIFILLLATVGMSMAQTTFDVQLVVVTNDGANFSVAVQVKGNNLPAAKTLNGATIDVTYDNSLLSYSGHSNWAFGTSLGYSRSTTDNVTFVRALVTGSGVGSDDPGDPPGFDVTTSFTTWVQLDFTHASPASNTDMDIVASSVAISIFNNPNNNPNTGENTSYDQNSINLTGLANQPLPVELTSFSATNQKGNVVNLQWETATEVNNYGFEVERSIKVEDTAAAEWEKISFVEGSGNSNSQKLYSFVDKNPVGGTKFAYRLKQIDIDGTFEYSDLVEIEVLPTEYELYQNYPNPFNPSTKIKFSLPEDAKVAVDIYNMLGQRVMTLFNKDMKAGYHQVLFDTQSAGNQLASGVYIYTISTKNFSSVKKMVLLK